MIRLLGGRGNSANYGSKTVRVPKPMLGQVEKILTQYRIYADTKEKADNPPDFTTVEKPVNPKAIELLQSALDLKPNAGGAIKDLIQDALELITGEKYERKRVKATKLK